MVRAFSNSAAPAGGGRDELLDTATDETAEDVVITPHPDLVTPDATGYVTAVQDGIITVSGLPQLRSGEIVWVQTTGTLFNSAPIKALRALVLNLTQASAQAILLGNEQLIAEGAAVVGTSTLFRLPCSLGLFGHVLNALGEAKTATPLAFTKEATLLVEQKATGIIDREPVRTPLRTGIKAIDSLVPIGRGQRELIIGDRQTGKTALSVDMILNHVALNNRYRYGSVVADANPELIAADDATATAWESFIDETDIELNETTAAEATPLSQLRQIVWFVYNAIGQKQSTVNQIATTLRKFDAAWFTAIVAATAAEPAPLQFLAPYTACTLGEFVRDVVGGHCVVIYDDLSKHAVAYRQMSLLLRRPPGREAFPGDVFYVHSRLLERAGSLTTTSTKTRGTLTAFPVIETQAGDVSAYIPTNVISITDGQVFLETELFYRGIRPAVNVGLSVSRVGSAAQPALLKRVAGSLKMELAQYREIEGFSKLGASLDDATQRILTRGENLIELLKQNLHEPLSTLEESVALFIGLGYSGAWLADALRASSPVAQSLFSAKRLRRSWLEWIRLSAPEFTVTAVQPLVRNVLNVLHLSGTVYANVFWSTVEPALVSVIRTAPLAFFDDIVFALIAEHSLVAHASPLAFSATAAPVALHALRFATTPTPTFTPSVGLSDLSALTDLTAVSIKTLARRSAFAAGFLTFIATFIATV